MKNNFDVIILGGGMAGLTLSLQLIMQNKNISILILEKRKTDAPEAAHKVGESIVELSAHYLRKDLGLKSYLEEYHLPKFGFRYFLDAPDKTNIADRIEAGSRTKKQAPSHHIDRGIFENDLVKMVKEKGVNIWQGAQVLDAKISNGNHQTIALFDGVEKQINSRWLIDASGRRSIVKRKLSLGKDLEHNVNAVWFRIKGVLDPQNWSNDKNWKGHLPPEFRRLSTNHFMGEGYWLWIIPLINGNTSIGIVANEKDHSFNSINSIEKVNNWIKNQEPLIAEKIKDCGEQILDFRVIKHYAHDVQQFISSNKWAITGEAGVFLDPFYSPGTDFIALSNTWISDLILRDLNEEDIVFRANLYEHTQRQLIDGWYSLYRDLYTYLSGTRVLLSKIVWDWSTYWAILTPLFIHKGFTDVNVMKAYASNKDKIGQRFNSLNENIQKLFKQWSTFDKEILTSKYINVFELEFLYKFHLELEDKLDNTQLINRLKANLIQLENIAAELFRVAYHIRYEKELVDKINPYTMDLNVDKSWAVNACNPPNNSIKNDLSMLWNDSEFKNNSIETHIERQKQVESIFLKARGQAEHYTSLKKLNSHLEQYSEEFKSVAYEGASFSLGIKALKLNDLSSWFNFKRNTSESHQHHIAIGLGWSFAALKVNPYDFTSLHNNKFLIQMIFDGMGYYNALYKVKRTLSNQETPDYGNAQELASFDIGVGRRIWYHTDGDSNRIYSIINNFPNDRQKTLWKGVGLACGYVAKADPELLKTLVIKSDRNHLFLSIGIVTSALYNLQNNRAAKSALESCNIIAGLSEEQLSNISLLLLDQTETSTLGLMNLVELNMNNLYQNI